MTFKELQEDAAGHGFKHMFTNAEQLKRLKRWINQAYRELCDEAPWPFLEESKEATSPLTIADLAHVLSVSSPTIDDTLEFLDRRSVVAGDPLLNDTGTAAFWYREGETTVKVWPTEAATKFTVRYMKAPAELVAEGDKPIVPEPYQELIVIATTVRLLTNVNNYEAAQFERQEWERGVKRMTHSYKPNYGRARRIVRTGGGGDYLG